MMTINNIHKQYDIPYSDIQRVALRAWHREQKGNEVLYRESEIMSLLRDEYEWRAHLYSDMARKVDDLIMEVED